MKHILIISAILLSSVCFGQTQPFFKKYDRLKTINPNPSFKGDTTLRVIYLNETEETNRPAIFINGTFVGNHALMRISPDYLENLTVEKESVEIDNVKYSAKLLLETKSEYKTNFISLNDFKEKHIHIKEKSVVFQIDDEIVQGDYNKYLIDENHVLRAIVKRVKIKNKKMDFTLVQLLSKTEKNSRDSKSIRIRGREGVAINP